jgi:hypothetical protein
MINNLTPGTEDYQCDCVHNNEANGSFSKVTSDLKYAELITCGKCNFKWYSNKGSIFGHGPCPRCKSKSPMMAEFNRNRLAQGANFTEQQKLNELKRVINLKWEIGAEPTYGSIRESNR